MLWNNSERLDSESLHWRLIIICLFCPSVCLYLYLNFSYQSFDTYGTYYHCYMIDCSLLIIFPTPWCIAYRHQNFIIIIFVLLTCIIFSLCLCIAVNILKNIYFPCTKIYLRIIIKSMLFYNSIVYWKHTFLIFWLLHVDTFYW